ncbi:MAG: helix-turn-helix domain-containing protein [Oscillospiraceae bacterium]|nr:helix-turn-helix domain-containing protein [Oscillospiraceae bacterium]
MPAWKEIVSYAGIRHDEIIRESNPQHDICAFRLLVSGMRAEKGSYLYLINRADLSSIQLEENTSIIVLDDGTDAPITLGESPCNCAVVNKENTAAVVREVNWLFTLFAQFDVLLSKLQSCVANGTGVQAMIDETSAALGFPVDLLDNSFCFIATGHNTTSALRQEFARPGTRLPVELLNELRDEGKLKALVESTEPVLVERQMGDNLFSAWLIPITFNRVKLGYLAVFCPEGPMDNWFPKEYLGYLHYIVDFFSLELNRVNFYTQNQGEVFSYVLSSLLESDHANLDEVRQRLKLGSYDLEKNLYLLCIKPSSKLAGKHWADLVAMHMRSLFVNSIYVSKDDKLYYLVSRSDSHPVTNYEQTLWREYLYSARLCAGMTGPFRDFSQIQNKKTEAELALSVSTKKRHSLIWFQNAQIDALSEYLRQQNMREMFYHQPTMALIAYDKEHGSCLVDTLQKYLENPKEPNAICEELHIHKNTLYKRLAKIKEVMGEDFAGAETVMQFQLTLRLLHG